MSRRWARMSVAGSGSLEYHLQELQIARDPARPEHAMPPYLPPPARILDIGCGAGQTLIAGFPDRVSFGIDVDHAALRLGSSLTDRIRFSRGAAEALPYRSDTFEMVIARVSLPYTYLSQSLSEIRRVLKADGQVWAVLHPFRVSWDRVRRSGWRGKLLFMYILMNSLLFHCCQRQFSAGSYCESFQTIRGIRRALERRGFRDIRVDLNDRQFVVSARKA